MSEASKVFSNTINEFVGDVEKICRQELDLCTSNNRLDDAFTKYDIDTGSEFEWGFIKSLLPQNVDKTKPDFAPKDANAVFVYLNEWDTKLFKTSTREDEIRKVIANKGLSKEEFASRIIANLTESESQYNYTKERDLIGGSGVDETSNLDNGLVAKNSKGIMYVVRVAYNRLKAFNTFGVKGVVVDGETIKYDYGVNAEDVRIVIGEDVLALIDITELAQVFNLEKEQLMGKLVVMPHDSEYDDTKIVVYDKKAFVEGTRLYQYLVDMAPYNTGSGYINHNLKTDKCFGYIPMRKVAVIDISKAIAASKEDVLVANE